MNSQLVSGGRFRHLNLSQYRTQDEMYRAVQRAEAQRLSAQVNDEYTQYQQA